MPSKEEWEKHLKEFDQLQNKVNSEAKELRQLKEDFKEFLAQFERYISTNQFPTGMISVWTSATAPKGWLLLDGRPYQHTERFVDDHGSDVTKRTIYAPLYEFLKSTNHWNRPGSGLRLDPRDEDRDFWNDKYPMLGLLEDWFLVPDFTGKMLQMIDDDPGQTAFAKQIGDIGGQYEHKLKIEQLPQHKHRLDIPMTIGQDTIKSFQCSAASPVVSREITVHEPQLIPSPGQRFWSFSEIIFEDFTQAPDQDSITLISPFRTVSFIIKL